MQPRPLADLPDRQPLDAVHAPDLRPLLHADHTPPPRPITQIKRGSGPGRTTPDPAPGGSLFDRRRWVSIQAAPTDLNELDLDRRRGSVLVRRGKGGRRREVGMDDWGFEQLEPWLTVRRTMPVGPLFCVINGPTRGRPWQPAPARAMLRRLAARAGVRRRFAPHQLRHAHAIELAHEGVPLNVIQRQLGHRNLGVTSIYLQVQEIALYRPPPLTVSFAARRCDVPASLRVPAPPSPSSGRGAVSKEPDWLDSSR